MDPLFEQSTQENVNQNKHQVLLVTLLGLVLMSLIVGYIYIGMKQAKNSNIEPVLEATENQEMQAEEMSNADRQAILESLTQESSSSSVSEEERLSIINSLSESDEDSPTISGEDRRAILESLNQTE